MVSLCSKTKHKALDNVMSVESVPWGENSMDEFAQQNW